MNYDYGNWLFALANIIIFLFFIKSAFKPRTKTDWKTYKTFGAFIVALFAEMYGFPLTIYLLSSFFGNSFSSLDFSHNSGHLLNDFLGFTGDPHFSFIHILSNVFIIGGLLLIAKAWDVLYKSQKEDKLAQSGVYHYMRHPQYTGFILIIAGFLLQWPTLVTLIMAPVLIWRYIRLGGDEEKTMIKKFTSKYTNYQKVTPAYIPSLKEVFVDIFKKLFTPKVHENI